MKKLFEILQCTHVVVGLCIVFFAARPMMAALGMWYLITISVIGFIATALAVWTLQAKWTIPHWGYIVAIGASGAFAWSVGAITLLAIYEIIPIDVLVVWSTSLFIFCPALTLLGLAYEWVIRPLRESEQG